MRDTMRETERGDRTNISLIVNIRADTGPGPGREKNGRSLKSLEKEVLPAVIRTILTTPSAPTTRQCSLRSWSSRRWRKKKGSRGRKRGGKQMKHPKRREQEG